MVQIKSMSDLYLSLLNMFLFSDFWQKNVKLHSVKVFFLLLYDIFVNETFFQMQWNM